jgi:hypothetical protein
MEEAKLPTVPILHTGAAIAATPVARSLLFDPKGTQRKITLRSI